MKIEEEIKQGKFLDEYEKAVINITVTYSWINVTVSKLMKEYGITPQQYNVLRILKGQKGNPATVNLIASRMLDKMSNASRIVDKLYAKGYVARNSCPTDRRAVDILITQKGIQLLEKANKSLYELYGEKFKSLSKDETKDLNGLLDKFRN
jgi:DNA-binding MarR family transcriptional regulator